MAPVPEPWLRGAVVVGAAFLPTLVVLALLRNDERVGREPWGRLLLAFLYGAVFSVALALVLTPLAIPVAAALRPDVEASLLAAVVVAPLVEEAVKAYGVGVAGDRLTRPVDGLVYGGAVALGFAATENLLYQTGALLDHGVVAWAALVLARSASSALLHPAATAVTGLGIAWTRVKALPRVLVLPFYAVAVALHGAYNLVATRGIPLDVAGVAVDATLPAAILVAAGSLTLVRALLRRMS